MKFVDTEHKKVIDAKLKLVKQQTAALWAAVCSDHVIRYFEQKHPHDERPRQAIAAARSWARGRVSVDEARKAAFAADAAAREATEDATVATAQAAGQAAATACSVDHALHASTYAAKSVFYATGGEPAAVEKERKWQYDRLRELAILINKGI
ncbi:putative immunity protein [Sporolactobacillus sp. STCC-11]|uniref:putative immunity protein n=1 Tax=Sporolactobacillus caesalpiniae TaxID=3230362 RepID=UPI003391C32D